MRISIAGSVPRSVLRTSWRTSSWTEWSRPRGDSGGHSRPNRQTWSALGRIAATDRDLPVSIAGGTFRSDLYYRFNVFPLEMPPLRDRKEDIPLLVEYFIGRYAKKAGKQIRSIARETLDRLTSYDWPGNVRELQNVIERSVIVCDRETVTVDESWLGRRSSDGAGTASRSFTDLARRTSGAPSRPRWPTPAVASPGRWAPRRGSDFPPRPSSRRSGRSGSTSAGSGSRSPDLCFIGRATTARDNGTRRHARCVSSGVARAESV